jgi:hypothetical protein
MSDAARTPIAIRRITGKWEKILPTRQDRHLECPLSDECQSSFVIASSGGIDLTWHQVLWGAVLAVLTFVVSNVVIIALLLMIPEDSLLDRPNISQRSRHPLVHWSILIAKNALGGILIVLGVIMALPGVPGPGLVSILLGVLLVSVPGKHRLARALLRHPAVLGTINRWRTRFGRPALILEPAQTREPPARPASEHGADL